jgi:L-threonylcarbamoyladenylate synthase
VSGPDSFASVNEIELNHKAELAPAGPESIASAAQILRGRGLVAFPTETVYGLGADATSDEAVAGIYAAKGRPGFNPLIAHVPDLASAQIHGAFNEDAIALAEAFWPGPLTLVVPVQPDCKVSLLARAGLDTLALRAPDHAVAQALLRALGGPVAAPSANRSGRVSPTTAAHVLADLGERIDMIIDGGACEVGVESTIVSCLDGDVRLLRPGGISGEAIEAVLGRAAPVADDADKASSPLAPGMLASHYAPRAQVRMNAAHVGPGEAVLDFASQLQNHNGLRLDLSPNGNLREAAANLFAYLRQLDAPDVGSIAVAPIPMSGLGYAINDRLNRAAAPR